MARLNEPPIAPQPSAETIDAVKRRFLRQNRELAKTNSQQSIRIRSLENDCSRLLAENLSLREQVLQLQNAMEAQTQRPSFENIDAVKMKLEAKMAELGGLVAELGQLKKVDERPRCKSQMTATKRDPDERQWRSGLGLQEVENQMLPTIAEGKFYPRRTMGADELREMLNDTGSQSPDIGPPPVSRFDNEEPHIVAEEPVEVQGEDQMEDPEPGLSVNLETRKKRRESGPKLNIRRVSVFESPPEEAAEAAEAAAKTSRAGSKRKFSVQEDEDRAEAKGETFRFSRRTAQGVSESDVPNEESRSSSPGRPILESKPVNTDPIVSPKKQRSSVQEKPEKNFVPASKSRGRARLNINRTITPPDLPLFEPKPVPTAEIVLDALPPKTPAVVDIFSPPSTESSTSRPESKDTPPPRDISAAGAGRPGRRSRPQVSYKEPSLHTKMRRPDAKLVDAVVDRRTSVESQAPLTTSKPTVEREPGDDLSWKPASAIPGRAGEEEAETGSPLRQKLDRREETKTSPASDIIAIKPSAASKAISALISETSTAKRKAAASAVASESSESKPTAPKTQTAKQEDFEKDNMAIFDFTDSSPADAATNPRARITDLAKAARNARRHSAVPAPSTTTATIEDRKQEGALPSLHKRTVSGTVKPAASSSSSSWTSNPTRPTSVSKTSTLKDKKTLPPTSNPAPTSLAVESKPKPSISTSTAKDHSDDAKREKDVASLRAERAALRRKSMML